jgi:hypothetical protein
MGPETVAFAHGAGGGNFNVMNAGVPEELGVDFF